MCEIRPGGVDGRAEPDQVQSNAGATDGVFIINLLHNTYTLLPTHVPTFHRADIPALAASMVEAVCLCELHLSSNLCDVKFHLLVHAALSILALGKCTFLDN